MDDTLRLYAIVRTDLNMTTGKLASQAGHAFVDTMLQCVESDPIRNGAYTGTKVVLGAPTEADLRRAYEEAQAAGIPCTLIIDSGHVMLPHFDGSPIMTALGIGPAKREEIQHITDKFQLVG